MKKLILNNKYFWIALILIFIASRIATWFYPFDSDHWIFFYVGKFLAMEKTIYLTAWDHKPPMGFVINSFMYWAFGANIIWHRIFLTALTVIEIFIFYKFAKLTIKTEDKNNNNYLVRLVVLLFVLLSNLSQFTSSGNNTENFAMIFLLLSYYVYFVGKNKTLHLLLSGFFISIIILLKPTFALLALPILIDLFINRKNLWQLTKNIFVFSVPIIFHIGFWVLYFWQRNALGEFWIAAVSFNSKYAQAAWQNHVSQRNIFLAIISPFLLFYAIVLFPYFQNIKKSFQDTNIRFILPVALIALALALMNGTFYPYYFLLAIFPLAILVANNIFINFIKNKKILLGLLILCIVANVAISYREFYNFLGGQTQAENLENQEIAAYIKANSQSSDTIIAYTYGATFYIISDRNSGSRYISASHLLLDERERFGYNMTDKFIADIIKNKPKYCIFPKSKDSLYLQNKKATDFLLENFTLEKEFDTYYLLKNNNTD